MYLETKRLKLENFLIQDINSEYIEWLNDPEHMKYSEQKFIVHDYISCLNYLDKFDFINSFFLKISFENKMIGTITIFLDKKEEITIGNIGLLIGPKFTGLGLGLEAWQGVKKYFGALNSPTIILAGTRKNNDSMNRLAVKSGMRLLTPESAKLVVPRFSTLNFSHFNYYYQEF